MLGNAGKWQEMAGNAVALPDPGKKFGTPGGSAARFADFLTARPLEGVGASPTKSGHFVGRARRHVKGWRPYLRTFFWLTGCTRNALGLHSLLPITYVRETRSAYMASPTKSGHFVGRAPRGVAPSSGVSGVWTGGGGLAGARGGGAGELAGTAAGGLRGPRGSLRTHEPQHNRRRQPGRKIERFWLAEKFAPAPNFTIMQNQ